MGRKEPGTRNGRDAAIDKVSVSAKCIVPESPSGYVARTMRAGFATCAAAEKEIWAASTNASMHGYRSNRLTTEVIVTPTCPTNNGAARAALRTPWPDGVF